MPSNRTRRAQPRVHDGEISPVVVAKLLSGHWWEQLAADGPCPSDDSLRQLWAKIGQRLVECHVFGPPSEWPGWIADPAGSPGTRPWAWWEWDAPEPRRQVRSGPAPIGPATWFGMPALFDGIPPSGMFEAEPAYLRRLDLLLPGEADLLR